MLKYAHERGDVMKLNELVARLIECGVPRITAVYLCNRYRRLNKLPEFERYVEAVEAECRVMEDV